MAQSKRNSPRVATAARVSRLSGRASAASMSAPAMSLVSTAFSIPAAAWRATSLTLSSTNGSPLNGTAARNKLQTYDWKLSNRRI